MLWWDHQDGLCSLVQVQHRPKQWDDFYSIVSHDCTVAAKNFYPKKMSRKRSAGSAFQKVDATHESEYIYLSTTINSLLKDGTIGNLTGTVGNFIFNQPLIGDTDKWQYAIANVSIDASAIPYMHWYNPATIAAPLPTDLSDVGSYAVGYFRNSTGVFAEQIVNWLPGSSAWQSRETISIKTVGDMGQLCRMINLAFDTLTTDNAAAMNIVACAAGNRGPRIAYNPQTQKFTMAINRTDAGEGFISPNANAPDVEIVFSTGLYNLIAKAFPTVEWSTNRTQYAAMAARPVNPTVPFAGQYFTTTTFLDTTADPVADTSIARDIPHALCYYDAARTTAASEQQPWVGTGTGGATADTWSSAIFYPSIGGAANDVAWIEQEHSTVDSIFKLSQLNVYALSEVSGEINVANNGGLSNASKLATLSPNISSFEDYQGTITYQPDQFRWHSANTEHPIERISVRFTYQLSSEEEHALFLSGGSAAQVKFCMRRVSGELTRKKRSGARSMG